MFMELVHTKQLLFIQNSSQLSCLGFVCLSNASVFFLSDHEGPECNIESVYGYNSRLNASSIWQYTDARCEGGESSCMNSCFHEKM